MRPGRLTDETAASGLSLGS